MSQTSNPIVFFEDDSHIDLLPLTHTRAACDILIGMSSIRDKWEQHLSLSSVLLCREYLRPLYKTLQQSTAKGPHLYLNARFLPSVDLLRQVQELQEEEAIVSEDGLLLAYRGGTCSDWLMLKERAAKATQKPLQATTPCISHPWDVFQINGQEILNDIQRGFATQKQELSISNTLIGSPDQVFIGTGARCEAAILNVEKGPIVIDRNATIMEGAMLRGPLYIGPNSVVKMGAKLYGNTSLGKHCKVGGELSNVVFQGYSNKGHDGYLGNALIGEWCNIGADTNASNLKNNYLDVKAWSYRKQGFINTNTQFCGLIMGDHSKCGINTMFNTGTVVGVSCNIFGGGFPRTFIPSFSWGGAAGFKTYRLEKAFETAEAMMKRRTVELNPQDKKMLEYVFNFSAQFRRD